MKSTKKITAKMKSLYDSIAKEYNESFPVNLHPEYIEKFVSLLHPSATVLDVGCAGGRDTDFLSQRGFNAVGVDYSDGQINYARSKYPKSIFKVADMKVLETYFPLEYFDGVYSYASLDHLLKSEYLQALTSFNRVMKKEGILLLCTRKGKGVLWTDDKYSQFQKRRFTLCQEEELKALCNKTGFQVLTSEQYKSLTRNNMEFLVFILKKAKNII